MKNFRLVPISIIFFGLSPAWVYSATASSPGQDGFVSTLKPKKKRGKADEFKKSQITSDRSEGLADRRREIVAVGVSKVIDLDLDFEIAQPQTQITLGNPEMIKTALLGKPSQYQLVLNPVAAGETNLTIRDSDQRIVFIMDVVVAPQNIVRMLEDLRRALRDVEGITVELEGQKIVVDGEVLSAQDYGRIANILSEKVYAENAVNRAVMSPVTMVALAKQIEEDIKLFAPQVKVLVINGKILVLQGSVESEGLKIRAGKRAEWYLPSSRVADPINKDPNIEKSDKPLQIIQNDIQVNPPPPKRESQLVRMTLYFVELSKDFQKLFGFKWMPGFTADPSISFGTNPQGGTATNNASGFSFAGTLSSLLPSLASFQSAGYARVVKTANVVVKSKEAGRVSDTISISLPAIGMNNQTAFQGQAEVGFDMQITPTILQDKDVDISISLSQKNLIGYSSQGGPQISNHSSQTRIYVKSGEVAAMVSYQSQDYTNAFNRDDPASGNFGSPNPTQGQNGGQAQTRPLFTMLRSKNFTKKNGQFVVFVSPQIIENASDGTQDLQKNFRVKSQ